MKKYSWIFALIMALTMAFVFTACPGDDPEDETKKEEEVKPPAYVPNPDAQSFDVIFNATGTGATAGQKATTIKKDGENSGAIDPGTVTYLTTPNGYEYAYGTGNNTNYGNAVLRFKLNLGDFALADYGKISFDWQATAPEFNNGNSVNSNKRLYLYATDDEAAVTPYVENKDLVVSNINKSLDWYAGGQGDVGVPLVNGLTKQSVEMPINYESRLQYLDGEVWFALYVHAEGGTYQITNLKFWAGVQTVTPTEPGGNAPPQPPTVADVPNDFLPLALDLNNWYNAGNAEVAPDVPSSGGSVDATGLTVNFTENNQRVNFKFSADQVAAIKGRKNNDVYINIDYEIKSGTGDSFRYHIGDATAGSNWNNTASLDAFGLADIAVATASKGIKLALGSNPTTEPSYFIFQHRSGDAITVLFKSVTVYCPPAPTNEPITLVFAAGDVKGKDATIELVGTNGFTIKTSQGYDNSWAYFKVKFPGTWKLSNYEKIDFVVSSPSAGNGDSGYKKIVFAAYAKEADIPTTTGMPEADRLTMNESGGSGGIANQDTDYSRTHDIVAARAAAVDGNEVWIAVRSHAEPNFIFTVKDIKFY